MSKLLPCQRLGLVLVIALAGCSRLGADETAPGSTSPVKSRERPAFTACQEPRPAICYELYAPVCASRHHQGRMTYANDCKACAEREVEGFFRGPCPPGEKRGGV